MFSPNHETEIQITQCVNLLQDILNDDLLGVYLYGSAIVGGLQKYSDVDLFVVSARPTSYEEKIELANNLLKISGVYLKETKRPIELTIVVQADVNPWQYPTVFDLQYGDWLREKFTSGNFEPWPNKVMPDLAILITQVLLANKKIFGPDAKQLLTSVPYRDFIIATKSLLPDLTANLAGDTRNILLITARMWHTMETNQIHTKINAATWAITRLPNEFKIVMQRARASCAGEEEEHWHDIEDLIYSCEDFMLNAIGKKIAAIEAANYGDKVITMATHPKDLKDIT